MSAEKTSPDTEFHAMSVIIRALRKLDEESKKRVVAWLQARFGNAEGSRT